MEKTIRIFVVLCVFFMVVLGLFLLTNNSYACVPAFCLYGAIIGLCISQNKNTQNLKHFAYRDAPTGLGNRTAFEERSSHLNKNIKKNKATCFSLTVFDLNNLKSVNDIHGHKAGDLYILEASRLIKDVYGECDLYRFGGDEFVSISRDVDIDTLAARKTKLQKKIQSFNLLSNKYPFQL